MKKLIIFSFFLQLTHNSGTWASNLPEPEVNHLIKALGIEASINSKIINEASTSQVLIHVPPPILEIVPDFKKRLVHAVNHEVKLHFFETQQALQQSHEFQNVNGIIGFCSTKLVMAAGNSLQWFHNYRSGMDTCTKISQQKKQRILFTNSKRLASPTIAEHAIAMLLSIARGIPIYLRQQTKKKWENTSASKVTFGEIAGKTMLVVGLGGIGSEVARRANALGMNVVGTRRSSRNGPDFVSYIGLSNELYDLASRADVIVNALPLTPETEGLFDQDFFNKARKGAIFISVGRGRSTITQDLVAAIKSGQIYGAGLDVTEPEPLPINNPLWHMDNVIITPHVAGLSRESIQRMATLAIENLRRYSTGKALLNIVNMQVGY